MGTKLAIDRGREGLKEEEEEEMEEEENEEWVERGERERELQTALGAERGQSDR